MTLNDLRDEISALGFESEIEADKPLISAANRALRTLYCRMPVIKEVIIPIKEIKPHFLAERIDHEPGENTSLELPGCAYSFTVSGIGGFSVTDKTGTRRYSFNTQRHDFRGYIGDGARITFEGSYAYTVYNLAAFSELYGTEIEDIPILISHGEIDMHKYVTDFLAFHSPASVDGKIILNQVRRGSTLIIPKDIHGLIRVCYSASPPTVNRDQAEEDIPIPGEFLHLLPLLTASYYWLDDDSEKSDRYLLLYKEGLRDIEAARGSRPEDYNDVLRWA